MKLISSLVLVYTVCHFVVTKELLTLRRKGKPEQNTLHFRCDVFPRFQCIDLLSIISGSTTAIVSYTHYAICSEKKPTLSPFYTFKIISSIRQPV